MNNKSSGSHAVLVTGFPWAGMSTPVKNTATYLLDRNWKVTIINIKGNAARFQFAEAVASRAEIIDLPNISSSVRLFFHSIMITLRSSAGSNLTILFDHRALLFSLPSFIFWPKKIRIYYSLEFNEPRNNFRSLFVKYAERVLSKLCRGVVSQDQIRADYLIADGIGKRVWIVPNAPRGVYLGPRWHPADNIAFKSDDDLTLLCIGTLSPDTLIDKVLSWYRKNNHVCKLKLHGWFTSLELKNFAEKMFSEELKNRLIISSDFIDDNDKWNLYLSADIVFVGFSRASKNLELAAGSAGKLYDAIRVGRPIIAIDSPGMRDLIEGNGVGIVVDTVDDLGHGISCITKNYFKYQLNCVAAHRKFSHDRAFSALIEDAICN